MRACSISWRTAPPSSTIGPVNTIWLPAGVQYAAASRPFTGSVWAFDTTYQCTADRSPAIPAHSDVSAHQRAYTSGGASVWAPTGRIASTILVHPTAVAAAAITLIDASAVRRELVIPQATTAGVLRHDVPRLLLHPPIHHVE